MDENLQVGYKQSEEFQSLYRQLYDPIRRYITNILRDEEAARDLTQNVFTKLYQNINRLRRDNLRSWLYKVAHNEAVDYLRRNPHKDLPLERDFAEPLGENRPLMEVQQQYEREQIKTLLLKLPIRQRTAILLKDVEGYSYEEIARAMGLSMGAIKSLLFRGRRTFIRLYREVKQNEMP